jgi:hypothetical protein
VQAPKRRDTKPSAAVAADRRTRLWLGAFALSGIVALGIVLAIVFTRGNKSSASLPPVHEASLPGLQTGPAPWPVEYAHLSDRLTPLGLSALPSELLTYHVHQHLDIFVNGKKVPVPPFVGINDNAYITQLHTHATSGVIHLEAARKTNYTLGHFIWEWGVRFTPTCLGAYCNVGAKRWHAYVDGRPHRGDMTKILLKNHEEIVLAYGRLPAKVPRAFDWAHWNGR